MRNGFKSVFVCDENERERGVNMDAAQQEIVDGSLVVKCI